jgi:outer membrane lipoprotein-sorting protein
MPRKIVGAAVVAALLLALVIVQRSVEREPAAVAEPPVAAEPSPVGAESIEPPDPTTDEPPVSPPPPPLTTPPATTPTPAPVATPPPAERPASPQTPAPQRPVTDPAPQASRILQQAADTYAGIRTMRAEFTMQTVNPLIRTTVTSRGTLYQQRPDRIALRFTDPDGDVIVGDGQYIWVYYPSVDARQVIRSTAGVGGAGGVDLQAQFLGDPVRRFEHTLDGTETVRGRETHALTLVPREPMGYAQLRIWIDARDRLVRRFEITEANGAVRLIDLENVQTNVAVPGDVFRFEPPADARIIDRG